ncbi:hypothetical protein [Luteimonas salinilitoris]|uniref:Uncharacterized protein n=1 Tax=Luteimonas salinilitoris TaxID=3237697 RepID=A0ABV4HP20_9GAMM
MDEKRLAVIPAQAGIQCDFVAGVEAKAKWMTSFAVVKRFQLALE